MDFLKDNTKTLCRKFLLATFVYSFADAITIGQYEGDLGTAAFGWRCPALSSSPH